MHIALALAISCFCLCGCSRPDGRAFDGLLSSNRIDRVEIVDVDQGRTNTLTDGAAARWLNRLAASNRVVTPIRGKSYVSGHVALFVKGERVGYLAYFPRERVLSYLKYEFSFLDTNGISILPDPFSVATPRVQVR